MSCEQIFQGMVIASPTDTISVFCEGKVFQCFMKGGLKQKTSIFNSLITIGDIVKFQKLELNKGIVISIEPRKTILWRQDHLHRISNQPLAANADLILITCSIKEPYLKMHLIDRYIIAAFRGGLIPVIVITKIDLCKTPEELNVLNNFLSIYSPLNIPILQISSVENIGLEKLIETMSNKVSIISGQSGVGKSTLINKIADTDLLTGCICRKTQKGSHVTSQSISVTLPFGGLCFDTPGIKSFGIGKMDSSELMTFFPEILKKAPECKFQNCSHVHEPSCKVKQAVEEETISKERYLSYTKLIEECA